MIYGAKLGKVLIHNGLEYVDMEIGNAIESTVDNIELWSKGLLFLTFSPLLFVLAGVNILEVLEKGSKEVSWKCAERYEQNYRRVDKNCERRLEILEYDMNSEYGTETSGLDTNGTQEIDHEFALQSPLLSRIAQEYDNEILE